MYADNQHLISCKLDLLVDNLLPQTNINQYIIIMVIPMQIGHEHRWLSGVVVFVQLGDTG